MISISHILQTLNRFTVHWKYIHIASAIWLSTTHLINHPEINLIFTIIFKIEMAIAQFFFNLVLHVLILVFLMSGVVPKYECVFLKPLEKVYKVRKRCGLLVETLISYYQLMTVSLCPDQVFPLADTSVNPSSSVWFTSSQNPKPFNTFCVSFKNDALQKTPRGRKWQV